MIHALMVLVAIVGSYKLGYRRGVNAGSKDAAEIAIELIELHYRAAPAALRKDFECHDTSKATPTLIGKPEPRVAARERFSDAYPQYISNGWLSRRNES